MNRSVYLFVLVSALSGGSLPSDPEVDRWARESRDVTITRDDWGIPHIHGKTDADAVFGLIYAQAEDDFNRVETNYINAMGRMGEAEGEGRVYPDFRLKPFIHPVELKAPHAAKSAWRRGPLHAFVDWPEYYLPQHPRVDHRVI